MMATTTFPAANAPNLYNIPSAGPSPPETIYAKPGDKVSHVESTLQPQSQSQSPTSNVSPPLRYPLNWNFKPRQLRQPRVPLYTPAALRPSEKLGRPTDIPGRPRAPDTPPASNESSFHSMHNHSSPAVEFTRGFFEPTGDGHEIESMRRGLSRVASELLEDEPEPDEVEGIPTTAHWKPDSSAKGCYLCNETFTWLFRRHHCRRCGNLVCDNHFVHTVPLDQNARYHTKGHPSKVCKSCWDGWKVYKKLCHSRTSSIADSSNSSQSTATAMDIPAMPHQKVDSLRMGSFAHSEGMVWSTF